MNAFHKVLSATVLSFGMAVSGAQAATYTDCSSTISGLVSGAVDCEISSDDQDFLNTTPITVNNPPGFFGFADWLFGTRTDLGSGQGQSGSYNFGSFSWALSSDIMLVFKDGAGTTLVGYLLGDGVTSGTWSSPFRTPDFDLRATQIKDVSHISVYYRGNQVPEPGTLTLLGLSLAGLAVAARRRRS